MKQWAYADAHESSPFKTTSMTRHTRTRIIIPTAHLFDSCGPETLGDD
jgi:hypothetical protein